MQYFFVLGNNPALSVAEIQAVLGTAKYDLINEQILMVEPAQPFDAVALQLHLGGTIKIGIVQESVVNNFDHILVAVKQLVTQKIASDFTGKFKFGFSCHGLKIQTKPLAMELKKHLKEQQISCRWVVSKEPTLSSVVVEQNKLVDSGIELVFFSQGKNIYLGQTLAVQPFKQLSARDYGRPARDDHSGMLPPKLAQIMINLAGVQQITDVKHEKVLLDPFCGSGTILSEALFLGIKKVIGTDLSERAVSDSQQNLTWLGKQYEINGSYQIKQADVRNLHQVIKTKVDVIATEPYLGPQRGQVELKKVIVELETLYAQALHEFDLLLPANGRVVMAWPVRQNRTLTPNLHNWKIVAPISNDLIKHKALQLTARQTIVYGRIGQKVWREIVILEKNKDA
jgi:tRNA G10  N-methylase Trm11